MNLSLVWRVPLFVVLAPVAAVALSVAHVALAMGVGDAGDPLGYAGVCLKGHE